jgi:hypothetical protein
MAKLKGEGETTSRDSFQKAGEYNHALGMRLPTISELMKDHKITKDEARTLRHNMRSMVKSESGVFDLTLR